MAVESGKIEQRVRLRLRRYEIDRLMKEKRSEELDALEEVFDKPTLMLIYQFLNKGILTKILGVLKSGKEARLYWGKGRGSEDVAVKIYLTWTAEFKKGRLPYIEGDPRFKRVKRDTRSMVYAWARKEFRNLQAAYEAGVKVPKPIHQEQNILIMEFIGVQGLPAPLLRESNLPDPLAMYEKIRGSVSLLYQKAHLVHGDLSEYNIMVWNEGPLIFDMAQSVTPEHPMADLLLKRDLSNINTYFRRLGVKITPTDELCDSVRRANEKQV